MLPLSHSLNHSLAGLWSTHIQNCINKHTQAFHANLRIILSSLTAVWNSTLCREEIWLPLFHIDCFLLRADFSTLTTVYTYPVFGKSLDSIIRWSNIAARKHTQLYVLCLWLKHAFSETQPLGKGASVLEGKNISHGFMILKCSFAPVCAH